MVDTVKILGALLGGGNMSSGSGANILKSVLGAATGGGQQGGGQGGGLGDLLGSVMKGQGQQQGGGGLGDILGSVLGGQQQGQQQSQQSGGGLGGMLGSVLGGGSNQSSGGGLGDILGSVLGGGDQQQQSQRPAAGGLNDLLGGLLGGGASQSQGQSQSGGGGLSDLIGAALNQFGHAEQAAQQGQQPRSFEEHSPNLNYNQASDQATVMIRAMVNAAKSDGKVDKEEQQKILGKLGSVTQDEIDFVNNELAQPLDVQGFARDVPRGMENQAYAMSLMAIDLDSNPEAKYLHELAQAMGIDAETSNQIHKQLGAPVLYS